MCRCVGAAMLHGRHEALLEQRRAGSLCDASQILVKEDLG